MAAQLGRDPGVYSLLKDKFLRRATITVRPTARGKKDIDDWHPFARYRLVDLNWLSSTAYVCMNVCVRVCVCLIVLTYASRFNYCVVSDLNKLVQIPHRQMASRSL